MTRLKEIYKCSVCGNIVEVLHSGVGTLVCCGKDMVLMREHGISQEGKEKHVPMISGSRVKVGNVAHPMTKEHHIEWIEGVDENGFVCKKFLDSGDLPEAEFGFEVVVARVYCNLHGLWKG
jgi:superoxide reductase